MAETKKKSEKEEKKKDSEKAEEKKEKKVDENVSEEVEVEVGEDGKKKKKEKRKLSESELKKVMTDTKETLVPLTDYIRCSVHLGTKVITPDMRKFVYKRRADGLAVMNTLLIDDKLRNAIEIIKKYDSKDIFITCKRESGWSAVEKFSEITNIRSFTKKYPAGIITNTELEDFFEAKLVIICDPWVDKNALKDAIMLKLPVIGISDTNNYTKGISKIVIGNNKSGKSLGLILFILAREYLKSKGKEDDIKGVDLESFTGKLDDVSSSD